MCPRCTIAARAASANDVASAGALAANTGETMFEVDDDDDDASSATPHEPAFVAAPGSPNAKYITTPSPPPPPPPVPPSAASFLSNTSDVTRTSVLPGKRARSSTTLDAAVVNALATEGVSAGTTTCPRAAEEQPGRYRHTVTASTYRAGAPGMTIVAVASSSASSSID